MHAVPTFKSLLLYTWSINKFHLANQINRAVNTVLKRQT